VSPRPVIVALAASAFHAAFVVAYVAAYHGDPSALVCADEKSVGRPPFEAVHVGFPADGYDGQYYYALARRPWARQSADVIDLPAYRHARILYPALAWMLTGGNPTALFWVLPAFNLAAIAGLAWCGALLARRYRRSPWWGFSLPLVLNAGMPMLRDLTDPLAAATLVGMLTAYWLEWSTGSLALWAVAAVLSREQNAVILVFAYFDAVARRDADSRKAMGWGIPSRHKSMKTAPRVFAAALLVAAGWIVLLRLWYGEWPASPANVSTPFSGIASCLTHLSGGYGRPSIINVLGMGLLFVELGLCVWLLVRHPHGLAAGIAAAGVGLAVLGGEAVYESGWSYARVFVWMPLAVWLWAIQTNRRWPIVVLSANAFWLVLATAQPWVKG
jgi:hypothetical protein